MEDEIDLRKYINVLLRHWKLIVSITLVAVVVAGMISFLLVPPPTYKAKASVLQISTSYQFSPTILTDDEYDIITDERWGRQQTLIALVKSNTLTATVIEECGDNLRHEDRNMEAIHKKIEVQGNGDLIEIIAKSSDADEAMAVANTWAECYEIYINDIYSGISLLQEQAQIPIYTATMVRFVDPAVMTEPETDSIGSKLTNMAIALVLGLIVGVFSAFGAEYFRNTGKEPRAEEVEELKEKPSEKEE